jgi:hypothetical protein
MPLRTRRRDVEAAPACRGADSRPRGRRRSPSRRRIPRGESRFRARRTATRRRARPRSSRRPARQGARCARSPGLLFLSRRRETRWASKKSPVPDGMSSPRTRGLRARLGRRLMRRLGWLFGAPLAISVSASGDTDRRDRSRRRGDSVDRREPRGRTTRGRRRSRTVVHRLYSATIRTPKLTAGRLLAASPQIST